MVENYDIIVVGAGPAGSIAAQTAAKNGFKTALLEKSSVSSEGRYKPCGGGITWDVIELIQYPREKIARVMKTLEIHFVEGIDFCKKGKGAVVWRSVFDKYLTDLAVKCGAILHDSEPFIRAERQNQNYMVTTSKSTYLTKYIIAADGVYSPCLKSLNWPPFHKEDLLLTITKEIKIDAHLIEQLLGNESTHLFFGIEKLVPRGYAWLFPKADSVSVGWGNQLIAIKNARLEFNRFLSLPLVKKIVTAGIVSHYQPFLIPVGIRPRIYDDHVFATGDAGGFVDPVTGKGIPYAMLSGKIAAETICMCEKKGRLDQLGDAYQQILNSQFLTLFQEKKKLRGKILENDDNLKRFLSLWQDHRVSEMITKNLL